MKRADMQQSDTTEASPNVTGVDTSLQRGPQGTVLKNYGSTRKDLEVETFELIAKVKELLHDHNLWGDDGTYTFKDGERWARLDIEGDDESE